MEWRRASLASHTSFEANGIRREEDDAAWLSCFFCQKYDTAQIIAMSTTMQQFVWNALPNVVVKIIMLELYWINAGPF